MTMIRSSNNRPAQGLIRSIALSAFGALLLSFAAQAEANDAEGAIRIDRYEAPEATGQLSASDARRRAYRYLAKLGYTNSSAIGGARVRSITREGDTWIARIAYSTGGRVLSRKAVLYIDADTALVSETPPRDGEGRVATR